MNKTTSVMIRLLFGIAVLLMIASVALAQPATGTVKRFTLKSAVLGEDRVILVRTPAGSETRVLLPRGWPAHHRAAHGATFALHVRWP